MKPVLLIDNLDSFTFNLVESLERIGAEVLVRRNSIAAATALAEAEARGALLMISPGPGTPQSSGCCLELIALAKGRVPLLGICLGHQAIVEEAGGTVTRAPEPVHGKSMLLEHDGAGPFASLSSPVRVARYHSLCTRDLPDRFTVHAEVDGMAMAFSDAGALQAGLQFHPESILTTHGDAMLANLIAMFG
ncbi:anthranilate synthase component II [Sphingomonas glaciei]|uniref:anthranilate synthase n=1 Tax=Sphingomonas glaciei TaxID=2938948 RepID=A0ABY5MWL9_9SPHN|nr:gamma-glutamyl-gamma-aminobutyrate hydrolase family protein [Sphingomonas glaciei]UUR07864.1 gamma-glutamyl-gamma-aminobutyrate hydrolase family protein [Sphingomonas glaciei]